MATVLPISGLRGMQRGKHPAMHAASMVVVLAELGREPVGGVRAGGRAEYVPQRRVVADQARPCASRSASRTGS